MNGVEVVQMPVEEARAAYEEYTKDRDLTAEDEIIVTTLEAMIEGNGVIDITQAFRRTGLDAQCRPLLAIGRADWRRVEFTGTYRSGTFRNAMATKRAEPLELPDYTFAGNPNKVVCRAIVPTIPHRLRPAKSYLTKYYILWEADWEDAPGDPLLLRHLTGSFFAVLGAWDLTPLERLVLQHTRSEEKLWEEKWQAHQQRMRERPQ